MKIGVNAMSLIKAMHDDFEGCVDRLKAGGCDYIEAMSDWGADPKMLEFYAGLSGAPSGWDPKNTEKRLEYLKQNGMYVKGMFIFDDLLEEQIHEMGPYCEKNGIGYVVLSFLHYDGIDDVYRKINLIKWAAEILRPYGVQVIIHNHEHDMLTMKDKDNEEKRILDIFLQQTTPEELMLEADTGWLLYADIDPASFIKEYLDRIMILHFKDICKEYKTVPREDIFLACGQGAVDFKAVLDVIPADRKGTMQYVLDQDASKGDIVEDQITSIAYFRSLGL